MPVVPLGVQSYARSASHQPETRLVNLYLEEDVSGASPDKIMRLQRPGLTRIVPDLAGPVRGIYQSDNPLASIPLVVAGDKLLRIDGSEIVELGTVENDGATVSIAATFERVGIVSAGNFYVYDGETVHLVRKRDDEVEGPENTLVDLDPVVDVDVLNGYFILPTTTGTFFWLVPGETSINPLNFATAEALPDGCVAVRRLRDDLFFFGSNSIEVWQPTGDADAPFQRANSRLIDRGCLSRNSVAVFDNSLVWVGDDSIVYRLRDVPERISTFGLEERLLSRDDAPSAWVFTSYGHKFYTLTIPGSGTFAYDAATQVWSENVWSARLGVDTATGALAADDDGGLFRLDPISPLDDGQPFIRLVSGTIALPARPVPNASLAIGVGSDDPSTFTVRWIDPRRDWSDVRNLQARGGSDVLNAWRLGGARAPYRTFEISTVAPTIVRISGAVANEGWRV